MSNPTMPPIPPKKGPPPKPERKTYKNDQKCENCGRYYYEHLAFKYCLK